ncbi:patatin-like phospholipase family protein [Shewanella marina]|uniref:patatin-like phospholipase family protein n=1 Tax=Shewanella marina TaxID=487319 RepID=UPI00046EC164|nr:patatin-like phospholipase family protein [Shewanella marina]
MGGLQLLAGSTAIKTITEQGINQADFGVMLAASGGPKWLAVAGLDKYLFSEFFKERQTPLDTLGTSSGAWRLACFAQQQPLAAYQRFQQAYIEQRYEVKPKPQQVSDNVATILSYILGTELGRDIVSHPYINSQFIACRAKGLNRSQSPILLSTGLAVTGLSNLLSRGSLATYFERFLFSTKKISSAFSLTDLPTQHISLTEANIADVLRASGSIPLLMAPVKQISGAPAGVYYDGGITDYHFDLALPESKGMVIYPHFNQYISPGWFDKSLPWRRARANYHNALVLAPSAEFVARLPYGKIPDRSDFAKMDTETRINNWNQVSSLSEHLADEFNELLHQQDFGAKLVPI